MAGSLELVFAKDTQPADLIGTTFDLFDWEGAIVSGAFDHILTEAKAVWDTSDLYTTGEVTLLWAVPEPSSLMLVLVAGMLGAIGRWSHDGKRT